MRSTTWIPSAVALLLFGCSSSPPAEDAAQKDAPPIDAALPDRSEPDVSPPVDTQACEKPAAGMRIAESTVLCSGEHALADPRGEGAIQIVSSGITLRCLDTVIIGGELFGSKDPKEIGIRIHEQQDVTIEGCTVRGYRFGLVGTSSKQLTIKNCDLSDNFTDEHAEWVFDQVQGGGIRFDDVTESTVEDSKLQRNWNGIDLRRCDKIAVRDNAIDHCTNTAALVIDTHHSSFERNDMSWGIRGGLTYPDKWWGVDTKDSASMLIEADSSYNEVRDNDLTYGGDGLFLRSVLGPCPHHNHFEGNDTSFSPHNAIESWCDDNTYIGNKANHSSYGFWLGGSDRTIVRGNEIKENHVDGMSIQIGESRTMLIEDNEISKNQRVGILATGREYQAWHNLAHWGSKLANASHYLIQRNRFADNARGDVFLSSIRGVLLASNSFGGANTVTVGKEALDVRTLSAGSSPQNQPPTAELRIHDRGPRGILLNASRSTDPEGKPLTFSWLVQPTLARFDPAVMPQPLLAGVGSAYQTIAVGAQPGVFEVFLTVDDGELGVLAPPAKLYVPPSGEDHCEDNAPDWSYLCVQAPACQTRLRMVTDERVVGRSAIYAKTDAPYRFRLELAAPAGAPFDLTGKQTVAMFVRVDNPNGQGWQINSPVLVLRSATGKASLEPATTWFSSAQQAWIYLEIPIGGSDGWTKIDEDLDPAAVTHVGLEMDTFGWEPYEVWLDGLTWY